jgi:hypothetical protein
MSEDPSTLGTEITSHGAGYESASLERLISARRIAAEDAWRQAQDALLETQERQLYTAMAAQAELAQHHVKELQRLEMMRHTAMLRIWMAWASMIVLVVAGITTVVHVAKVGWLPAVAASALLGLLVGARSWWAVSPRHVPETRPVEGTFVTPDDKDPSDIEHPRAAS